MNEKLYKGLGRIGGANLALGICILIGGLSAGILLIINGGRLLHHKANLTI